MINYIKCDGKGQNAARNYNSSNTVTTMLINKSWDEDVLMQQIKPKNVFDNWSTPV